MPMASNFYEKISLISEKDPRYKPDAYEFLIQALCFTQKRLGCQGHVSGNQLLEGIRDLAIEQYGPLAKAVFNHWGIFRSLDFGNIVFNMIEQGVLTKTEDDKLKDFENGFDFDKELDVFNSVKR